MSAINKLNRPVAVIVVLLSSILFVGCLGVDHNFLEIKNSVLSKMDHSYRTEQEFGLGFLSLAIARTVVNFSHNKNSRMAKQILANVSKVQVGIYKNVQDNDNLNLDLLRKLDKEMNENGWYYIVKSCDHGEVTAVYVKEDREEVKGLFVISAQRNEVDLVNVEGNLTQAVLIAVREKGLNVNL